MIMGVGIGGPAAMNARVIDRRTGASTNMTGAGPDALGNILRGAAQWSQGQGGMGLGGMGGGMRLANGGMALGANAGAVDFMNRSMQQSAALRPGTGAAARTGPAMPGQFAAGASFGGVPLGPAGAGAGAFSGGGGMGGGNIQGLLQQQQVQNDAARATNTQRWNNAEAGVKGVVTANNANPITQGTRGLVQDFLNNPESLNDPTVNSIRNRQTNQIRGQADNQFNRAQGILAADGQMDTGSLLAARRGIDRQAAAQMQNANQQLDVTRANQRTGDMARAIGLGQAQSGQDAGLNLDVNKTIMSELPQEMPDDLSGWIGAFGNEAFGGGGGGGYGGALGGMGGGFGAPVDPMAAAGFGSFQTPQGFSGPKGPSTQAGFNWTDRSSIAMGQDDQGRNIYGTMERPLGVDPLATGGFGALGSGERMYDMRGGNVRRMPLAPPGSMIGGQYGW